MREAPLTVTGPLGTFHARTDEDSRIVKTVSAVYRGHGPASP